MLRRSALAVLALLAVCSTAVLAQTMEATPIPSPPKPNFAPMKYFLGAWSCSSKSSRRPTPQLSTSVVTLDPGGRWMIEKSVNHATSWFPYTVDEVDQFTYDGDAKRWVDVETDTLGGYDLSATKGWTGNALVWTDISFAPGKDVASETTFTITKNSATKFTGTNAFTTTKGRTVNVETVCTKST
jgi:hypothetical protein